MWLMNTVSFALPSGSPSSATLMVTFCELFQLALVKVNRAGMMSTSPPCSRLGFAISVTTTSAVGALPSATP